MVSFDVTLTHVAPVADFDGLVAKIEGMGLPRGIATSLLAKVHAAARAHDRGNLEATRGPLGALLNQINALDGNQLTLAQAAELREYVEALIAAL
jgi:hypothetical protein